jgi:hypothetical protein
MKSCLFQAHQQADSARAFAQNIATRVLRTPFMETVFKGPMNIKKE